MTNDKSYDVDNALKRLKDISCLSMDTMPCYHSITFTDDEDFPALKTIRYALRVLKRLQDQDLSNEMIEAGEDADNWSSACGQLSDAPEIFKDMTAQLLKECE